MCVVPQSRMKAGESKDQKGDASGCVPAMKQKRHLWSPSGYFTSFPAQTYQQHLTTYSNSNILKHLMTSYNILRHLITSYKIFGSMGIKWRHIAPLLCSRLLVPTCLSPAHCDTTTSNLQRSFGKAKAMAAKTAKTHPKVGCMSIVVLKCIWYVYIYICVYLSNKRVGVFMYIYICLILYI